VDERHAFASALIGVVFSGEVTAGVCVGGLGKWSSIMDMDWPSITSSKDCDEILAIGMRTGC
jgi:hypothetical protein